MLHTSQRFAAVSASVTLLFLLAACAASAIPTARTADPTSSPHSSANAELDARLAEVEERFRASVGVSVIALGSGAEYAYRGDERFLFASTMKAFVAAALLATAPREELSQKLTWTEADLQLAGYSPVTSEHIEDGMTLAELGEAAVRFSDNTASNLLVRHLGGPSEVTAFMRSLGDDVTNVVDYEPDLNQASEDTMANTTTAEAVTDALAALLSSNHFSAQARDLWLSWMSGNATGDELIRAGAPTGWTVADKSGGAGPVRNDIAVITSPHGSRYVMTVLSTRTNLDEKYDNQLISDIAAALFLQID